MKQKILINRAFFIFVSLLLVVFLYSCEEKPVEYEYKQRIVKTKTLDLENGTTRYNIAFTDGNSGGVTFGLYLKYEVGDTICWKREKGWFWYIIDCH